MSAEHVPTGPGEDQPGVERLLALSDGVVAIALTLLVLQLTVPSLANLADPNSASELATQLGKGADELISYVISFYVIAQFWLVHHRVFRQIAGQQEGLAWWNFAFLFTITLMPFTSDLLGKYPENPLAVDIFAVNLLAASLTTQLTIVYGRRKDLLTTETSAREAQAERARDGGKRVRHRLVHRHRLGEHGRRQILLAPARRRTPGGRPLVWPPVRPRASPGADESAAGGDQTKAP